MIRKLYNAWYVIGRRAYKSGWLKVPYGKRLGWLWPRYLNLNSRRTTRIQGDAFAPQREVSFFLRLHRHLPDYFCGDSPLSGCKYRPDGNAINMMNERLDDLQKDPAFVAKEKEIDDAVEKKWKELGKHTWKSK